MSARAAARLAVAAAVATASVPALAFDAQTLVSRLEARFRDDRSAACLVAAAIDGERVVKVRYCARPRAGGGPGFDEAFEIGSISKTMTAALVQDLIEQGRWSLDDPIERHLPPGTVVPRQGERRITVRDLVTHSAGLPPLPARLVTRDPADPYAGLTPQQLLDSLADVKLGAPIGSRAEYSNFGMMVLSLAVARAHGGDLPGALRARLFEPLGMRGAWVVPTPTAARAVPGHLPGAVATPPWTIAPALAGVGMVHASLDDMVRYAQAQLGQAEPALARRLQATQRPLAHGFGMNWALAELGGHRLVMHEGGTGGFSALLMLEPAQRRALVVLADTALADLGGLGEFGLSMWLPERSPGRPRREAEPPPALLKALAGDWDVGGLAVRLSERGGRLVAEPQGQGALELRYDDHGDFYPTTMSGLATPVLDNGRVDRLLWRQGGGVVEAQRRGVRFEATAQNPAWRELAGEYALLPQFSLRIFERDGQLWVQGTGQAPIAARLTGPDRLEVREVHAVVEFRRDAAGRVVAATLLQHGQRLEGARR